jgi:hypothetical protein
MNRPTWSNPEGIALVLVILLALTLIITVLGFAPDPDALTASWRRGG